MQRVRAMASSNWQTVGTISSGFDASARPTFFPGVTTTANCHLTAVVSIAHVTSWLYASTN